MKRTALILLISGFWLLVSGFYTNTHAQDETLTLLTYYPAPYGVYQTLELMRDSASTTLTISAYHNTESTSPTLTFRKADNTMASPQSVDNYALLGTINFQGYDNNSFDTGARIYAEADANWTADERGTELYFMTRDADEDLTERMVITATGKIGVGTDSPKANKLDIKTTVDSMNSGIANLPVRIRKNFDGAQSWTVQATGIGFTVSNSDNDIGAKIVHQRADAYSRGGLVFYTKSPFAAAGDTTTEKMRITSSGKVGIGVFPTEKLHVVDTSTAIYGESQEEYGIYGNSDEFYGVYGYTPSYYSGVYGYSPNGLGVEGESINAGGVAGYSTNQPGTYGNSTNHYGVIGISTNSSGVFGQTDDSNDYGVYGRNYGGSGIGVYGRGAKGVYGKGVDGVQGEGTVANFRAVGTGADYATFTGAHDIKLSPSITNIQPGMILISNGVIERRNDSISSTITTVELASNPMDNRIFGVFVSDQKLPEDYWYKPKEGEKFGLANAVGEGLVLVTDINGLIKNGDYITTSNIPGYGQKQDDDILHSYTLGKATQDVNWDSVIETVESNGKKYKKCLIAVTYHCG